MSKTWNKAKFPRLAAYLKQLPNGFASYPECKAKGAILRSATGFAKPLDVDSLPDPLSSYIAQPRPVSYWIPETVNIGMFLSIRDAQFDDDASFKRWVYALTQTTLSSPVYRMLMWVSNPNALAKGSRRRWNAFHRGTTYESRIDATGTASRLMFPPHLFPADFVRAHLQAVLAGYHACGADHATAKVVEVAPEHAVTHIRWRTASEQAA